MAQSGDGSAANDSGSAIVNLLGSPVGKVFLINRGATEVFVRVVYQGGGLASKIHKAGHDTDDYATMRANEPRVFGSENGPYKIKELYIHTASGSSTVDWHSKTI